MSVIFKFVTFIRTLFTKYRLDYYRHLYGGKVSIASDVIFGSGSHISIPFNVTEAKLVIGNNTRFRQYCIVTLDALGHLTIGNNTFFNNYCSLNCLGRVVIGDNTLFGEAVRLYDHNHLFNKKGALIEEQGFNIGFIEIGNNCWIGSNVVILRNVKIGDNVVIGAGCIIDSSIPSNTIVKSTRINVHQEIMFR